MKKIIRDLPHYLSLLGIFGVGMILFSVVRYDTNFRIALSAALAVSYVTWGVIHHLIHKDLYWVVVFEYITVAALGFVVILSVILRV